MIGKRLKELRRQKDVSQEELSKALNITTSAVGQYEIDARNPSFDVLIKMSKFFCVSTDYILGLTDDVNKSVNVPKDYALVISEALSQGVSSDKLKKTLSYLKSLQDE